MKIKDQVSRVFILTSMVFHCAEGLTNRNDIDVVVSMLDFKISFSKQYFTRLAI